MSSSQSTTKNLSLANVIPVGDPLSACRSKPALAIWLALTVTLTALEQLFWESDSPDTRSTQAP